MPGCKACPCIRGHQSPDLGAVPASAAGRLPRCGRGVPSGGGEAGVRATGKAGRLLSRSSMAAMKRHVASLVVVTNGLNSNQEGPEGDS